MRTPEKVREIVRQMKRRVQIPVTVKCRLGVDNLDSSEFTRRFVEVSQNTLSAPCVSQQVAHEALETLGSVLLCCCKDAAKFRIAKETVPRFSGFQTVSQGGCEHFIMHARKAWLQVCILHSFWAARQQLKAQRCSALPSEFCAEAAFLGYRRESIPRRTALSRHCCTIGMLCVRMSLVTVQRMDLCS